MVTPQLQSSESEGGVEKAMNQQYPESLHKTELDGSRMKAIPGKPHIKSQNSDYHLKNIYLTMTHSHFVTQAMKDTQAMNYIIKCLF